MEQYFIDEMHEANIKEEKLLRQEKIDLLNQIICEARNQIKLNNPELDIIAHMVLVRQ